MSDWTVTIRYEAPSTTVVVRGAESKDAAMLAAAAWAEDREPEWELDLTPIPGAPTYRADATIDLSETGSKIALAVEQTEAVRNAVWAMVPEVRHGRYSIVAVMDVAERAPWGGPDFVDAACRRIVEVGGGECPDDRTALRDAAAEVVIRLLPDMISEAGP